MEIPHISKSTKCTKCSFSIQITDSQINEYFYSNKIACPHCGGKSSLWEVVCTAIEENFFFNDVFTFIGAKCSIFTVSLVKDVITTVRFEDYGIPKGARILHVNYTPQGDLFPIEMHGNSPYRGMPRDTVSLYPASIFEGKSLENDVSVMVTWIELDQLVESSFGSLVQALEEYSQGNYQAVIVPANTAIEFQLTEYTENVVVSATSKTSTKEFFDISSYVPTLKTLIPLIASLKGFPKLPREIQENLLLLASWRNQIAHTGKTKSEISQKSIAKCLSAVVLGAKYIALAKSFT